MRLPSVIADLYGQYGARLLEQNVRTFLQVRGKINKGIRTTILKEPDMFFAYNNGITATAEQVVISNSQSGDQITFIKDLQIVNGGQTTASLFHARRKDKADMSKIFVQVKLSVIDRSQSDTVVPKISEYANTQNRVNAADFFSNHPFHIRMEEISRRLLTPQQQGRTYQTKWFYERARGQYADRQSALTEAQSNKFRAENPKSQMFTKTDLAKYENTFGDQPWVVHWGSQKNFAEYAKKIALHWGEDGRNREGFNEWYFKRIIGRTILFRATEKIVMEQEWYGGGYRANIVAYTLSALNNVAERHDKSLNYKRIWDEQSIDESTRQAIAIMAKYIHEIISKPPAASSNISEWCKKKECWISITNRLGSAISQLPVKFLDSIIPASENKKNERDAENNQVLANEMAALTMVLNQQVSVYKSVLRKGTELGLLTDDDKEILLVIIDYFSNRRTLPTGKQAYRILAIQERIENEP